MGQNNNQNSTGQGFKKDDAYQTLSMINTWIGNIDTKISFALALAGVLSMIKILNYKLQKKKYDTISVGIGIDNGRALMVKAGYSGSGINEIVWMGDVVNTACHLANKAGRGSRNRIIVTEQIYSNLNDKHKGMLSTYTDGTTTRYEGNIVRTSMENWYKENCK